jgi:hypothetical protein
VTFVFPRKREPSSRGQWFEAEFFGKVAPPRVRGFDQFELPGSVPFLDALLARDRAVHRGVNLEPDEHFDTVLGSEAADLT